MKRILLSPEGAAGGGGTGTGTAEAGGAGGGGEGGADKGATGEALFSDEGGEAGGGEGDAGGEGAAATEEKTTGLSKEDITEILHAAIGVRTTTESAPQATAKVPTPEELERLFNVWKPDAALLTQLRSEKPDEALAALTALRDGLLKQAMTMSEHRVQQLLRNLRDEQLAPLQEYVTEAQATSFRNDFFKANPDLEQYETIVDAVAAKLQSSGFTADSRDAVMKKFAEETKKIVQTLLAQGGGGNGSTTDKGKTGAGGDKTAARRMSTLTGGGQGGGGNTQGGKPKAPSGMEVFDD